MKLQIIGRGNVATHLVKAFSSLGPTAINPHSLEGLDSAADITLISVSDKAISDVAAKLPPMEGIVAHTSGSIGMEVLKERGFRCGVLYPMQTFSKEVPLNYCEIPFFTEGSDAEAEKQLAGLASSVSQKVMSLDSKGRKLLHIAAVLACNFTNHLYAKSEEILAKGGMDFEVMLPLIKETTAKLGRVSSPIEAQTGPAVRGDANVVKAHIDALRELEMPGTAELYRALSASINPGSLPTTSHQQ